MWFDTVCVCRMLLYTNLASVESAIKIVSKNRYHQRPNATQSQAIQSPMSAASGRVEGIVWNRLFIGRTVKVSH